VKTKSMTALTSLLLLGLGLGARAAAPGEPAVETVSVAITGGFRTDPRDNGRPVILVASALGVSSKIFRDAFSRVHPAPAGSEPDPEQVRRNKDVLLAALGPHGVSNARLDEVSSYYRCDGSRGELWKHHAAKVTVELSKGKAPVITVLDYGAGYTSPPKLSVPGHPEIKIKASLVFGFALDTNGSLSRVEIVR
jgi:hypothetical protein